jgi:hypothetical protein
MKELDPIVRNLIDAVVDGVAGVADELAFSMKGMRLGDRLVHLAYWDMRLKGSSPRLAEMLALQSPPMSNTDREFLEGHCNGNQFSGGPLAEEQGNRYKKIAEAGGQNVTGKVYMGGLARFPGDPEAWVSDRGDVKRVVEARGWKCQGSVEVTPDGKSDDLAAIYRESKVKPGPGLDMDEDGFIEPSSMNEEQRAEMLEQKLQEAT